MDSWAYRSRPHSSSEAAVVNQRFYTGIVIQWTNKNGLPSRFALSAAA
jgi:hypothetical protein